MARIDGLIPGCAGATRAAAVLGALVRVGLVLSGAWLGLAHAQTLTPMPAAPLQRGPTLTFPVPSHGLPWLTRPAGPISQAEAEGYYARQPTSTMCRWQSDLWSTWTCPNLGADPTFDDWIWDVGLNPLYTMGPSAFYNPDLREGRRAVCFESSTPGAAPKFAPVTGGVPSTFSGAGRNGSDRGWNLPPPNTGIACFVTNHGVPPGLPGFPQPAGAKALAGSNQGISSISAMFFAKSYDVNEVASIHEDGQGYWINGPRMFPSFPGDTLLWLWPGDTVTMGPATGDIWAGDSLYGRNDPNGIVQRPCVNQPLFAPCKLQGAPLYSLLVQVPSAVTDTGERISGLRFLGTRTLAFKVLEAGPLEIRINDGVPGNGDGKFDVPIRITRHQRTVFMVFVPSGPNSTALTTLADTDSEGQKRVPTVCISCHGGRWDPQTLTVEGASFLPFDAGRSQTVDALPGSPAELTRQFGLLNGYVRATRPLNNDYIAALVDGMARDGPGHVPPGWAGDAALYTRVVRPYCQMCHQALSPGLNFSSSAQFRALTPIIRTDVCDARTMPHNEGTFIEFWLNGGVVALRQLLLGGAPCGPSTASVMAPVQPAPTLP